MLIMNRRCDAERQEGVAYYMMPRYHLVNVTVSVREDLFWKRFGNLNKRTLEYYSVKSVLYRKNSTFVDRRVQRSESETVPWPQCRLDQNWGESYIVHEVHIIQ